MVGQQNAHSTQHVQQEWLGSEGLLLRADESSNRKGKPVFSKKKIPQVRAGEELNPLPRVVVLTTSVLVILASSSVRLSRLSLWSVWSSCRPQMAAPMLPLAIMEGGFMASRSSARDKNINVQSVKQQQQQQL